MNLNECCPPFDPAPWRETTRTWTGKRFVKDRVRSIFHIPVNFGSVMKRNMQAIEAAQAAPESPMVLADENSLWGSDVYIAVTRDVPGCTMATLSGTYYSKVYEGPYRNIRLWVEDMQTFVRAQGREIQKMLFFYTTCPKCARKYGRNYVVLLAQV